MSIITNTLARQAATQQPGEIAGRIDVPVAEPRMKICVLAACPFPANHGTPGSIRELAEATVERGHEVHIVTYHFGEDLPLRGVHVHRIRDRTGERQVRVGPTKYRPLYDFQMIWKAREVVRKYDLDLMHAHGYEAVLAAGCCRPMVRRKILYSAHNSMGDELASYDFFSSRRFATSLAWVLDRTAPRLGDRCLPHSANLQQFLADRGLANRTEPVLNFGIDLNAVPNTDRDKMRQKLGLGDEPVVLYSGVIDQFQRLDLLLEGMVNVIRSLPKARLLILSTIEHQEHQQRLWDQANRLGIARHLAIQVPTSMEHGLRLISLADVAVVPRPAAPGFPIKLLNYMLAARPCVLFASSASRVAHGEHVWLAAQDTGESLGHAILQLLRREELAARIAAGGHRFVCENHDRRLVAAQLCRSYQRLLEGTKRWNKVAQRPPVEPDLQRPHFETTSDTVDHARVSMTQQK